MNARILRPLVGISLGIGVLLAVGNARAGGCVAGQQIACACANGTTGAQTCSEDGEHFQPCLCAAPVVAPITVYTGRPPSPPPKPGHALFSGGLAMTILGGLMAPPGAIMLGVDLKYSCAHVAVCGAGVALLTVGVGLLVAGPIMMVLGKNKEAAAEPAAWIPSAVAVSDHDVVVTWRW